MNLASAFLVGLVGGGCGALVTWMILALCRASGIEDDAAEAYQAGYVAGYEAATKRGAEMERRSGREEDVA